MAQLSTAVNPCKPSTLPRYTIKKPKNDGYCMEITTQRVKLNIDPPMSSVVEDEMRKHEVVVDTSGEFLN